MMDRSLRALAVPRGWHRAFGCLLIGLVALLVQAPSVTARDGPALGNPLLDLPLARPAALTFDVGRICDLIDGAATRHGLPKAFFARLIWKESRFDIAAVSPVGAQGIAQFMPATARLRGLQNPNDPRQAIPASAHFLADLRAQFGNFGLAAAAYNGGPNRVARWLARGGGLPLETEDYVKAITFRPASWFRDAGREVEHRPLKKDADFATGCRALPIMQTRSTFGQSARAPWGVQVAAGITRRAAQRAYSRVRKKYSRIIGGRSAFTVRAKRRAAGAKYSVRVGAPSRNAARKLCARLKRAGGFCLVRRN